MAEHGPPPFLPETALAAIAQLLTSQGRFNEASAIANSIAVIELHEFDNWNGGTYTWDLQVQIPFDQYFSLSEQQRQVLRQVGDEVMPHVLSKRNHSSIVSFTAQPPKRSGWRDAVRIESIKKFSAEAEGDGWYGQLELPQSWRFTESGPPIQDEVVAAFHSLGCQMASKTQDEQGALETFKSKFGGTSYSSSTSWAVKDLSGLMSKMADRPVDFIDAFWRSIVALKPVAKMLPTFQRVNEILTKYSVPFRIDPPRLVQSPPSATPTSKVTPPVSSVLQMNEDHVPIDAPKFGSYSLVRLLRGGGMAEAWEARNSDGKRVFLKRVREQAGVNAKALSRESSIYVRLCSITAANARMLEVIEWVRDSEWVALVTEFADGGDLSEHVEKQGPLSTTQASVVMRDVVSALEIFHQNAIVHRDIKPQNIVQSGGLWKIADFGIAKDVTRLITNHTFQRAGTQAYMPPEQRQGAEAAPSMDIFALGKLLTFVLTGQTDPDAIHFENAAAVVQACIRQMQKSDLQQLNSFRC
jgi:hypothetical protein